MHNRAASSDTGANERSLHAANYGPNHASRARSRAELQIVAPGASSSGDPAFLINIGAIDLVRVHNRGVNDIVVAVRHHDGFGMELNTGFALDAPRRRNLRDVALQRGADRDNDIIALADILDHPAGKRVAGAVVLRADWSFQFHADGCADGQGELPIMIHARRGINPERLLPLRTGLDLR